MRRLLVILALMVAPVGFVSAKKVRTGPTRPPQLRTETVETIKTDTILAPDTTAVRLSGYDKTLRTTRESFFVTNSLPDSVAIVGLELIFDYTDMSGRQLHNVERKVKCYIPRGQTRRLDVASWDKQQTFYYYLSNPPKRTQATPYRVKSIVKSVLTVEQ